MDNLGRIVIPKELRRELRITPHTYMEISVVNNCFVLKKAGHNCSLCGENNETELIKFNGSYICCRCADMVRKRPTNK